MMRRIGKFTALAATIIFGLLLAPTESGAVSHWPVQHPYRFEIVNPNVHAGKNELIAFRIIRTSTNEVVSDASIMKPQLTTPDNALEPVPGKIIAFSSDAKGDNLIAAELPTPGTRFVTFLMRVPGEDSPVPGTLAFHVIP